MNNTTNTEFHNILARNARDVLRKCGLSTDIVGDSDAQRMQAADTMIEQREKDRASFHTMFPGAARIRVDTSGIPVPARAKPGQSSDAAGSKGFYDMFPDAGHIRHG